MVLSCAAFGADSEVTFHRIPKIICLKQRWPQQIKREGKLLKDEFFFVFSVHFEENCF